MNVPSVTSLEEALKLLSLPDMELLSRAAHLRHAVTGCSVRLCAIINIRSGHCGMDCRFCAQSRHNPGPQPDFPLLEDALLRERILALAATSVRRIGLVASGAALDGDDFERVLHVVTSLPTTVRGRVCASFGRLDELRLIRLAQAGITRYHHNLETSERWYPNICTTQRWEQRRDTARRALDANLSLCCGGIFGLGETWEDRISLAFSLRELGVAHVPLNFLHPQLGTPFAQRPPLTPEEALRIIAIFRHILPQATLRVCGGRPLVLGARQDEMFAAGANALMTGDYLTTSGESLQNDLTMIAASGMEVDTYPPSEVAPPLRAVFVAGTGTDVGKTVVTGALLRALRELGVAAQAVKPVQTGIPVAENTPSTEIGNMPPMGDAAIYAQAVADIRPTLDLPPAAVLHTFSLPASPHFAAAAEGICLKAACIARSIHEHWARQVPSAALLLLETAGGLLTPLNMHEEMLDLMGAVSVPVILTVRNELGALNHALLSLAALRRQGLALAAIVVVEPPHQVRVASGTAILQENIRYLRERLAVDWPEALLCQLPHTNIPDPKGWNLLARLLLPLAHSLTKHSALSGAAAQKGTLFGDMEARDHAALWHPYASAICLPPLETAARSYGNRIVLADGRELVDGMSSWWAAVHGYNHPHLLAALRAQSDRMPHVMFGGLTHAPAVALGERLLTAMPDGLDRLFFADSGSVAVEVALKMALQCQQGRGQWQRIRFLAPRGGYHGDTLGAMSVCDPVNGMHTLFAGLLPQQIFMERPSCRFDAPFTANALDDARRIFTEHGDEIAAVILEPVVQGAGGMWFYHPDYLRGLAELCHRAGALLIFDEIATGFGRTGRLFAAEWAGLCPDILCCGKALTGGVLTLAATACTAAVAEDICRDGRIFMHGPTFMGNPLACAVASASLDILEENRWQAQVAELERLLSQGLEPCRQFSDVADVRVLGAIGVVEMVAPVNGVALQHFFVEHNVWIRPFGRLIYLMPPYITPPDDVAQLCAAVAGAVEAGIWRLSE